MFLVRDIISSTTDVGIYKVEDWLALPQHRRWIRADGRTLR
jgi:hypothetical protein